MISQFERILLHKFLVPMTSHRHGGVFNLQQFDWLFNSLFRLTSKKILKALYWPFVRGTTVRWWRRVVVPSQRANNAENSVMWWHRHDPWYTSTYIRAAPTPRWHAIIYFMPMTRYKWWKNHLISPVCLLIDRLTDFSACNMHSWLVGWFPAYAANPSNNYRVGLWVNSLAPVKFEWNFRHVILKQILVIDGWGIYCEIALIWMSLDFTDDQSTLVQGMAWCRQATSHYLSQFWLIRCLSPYCVTMPQRVDSLAHGRCGNSFKSIIHALYLCRLIKLKCDLFVESLQSATTDGFPTQRASEVEFRCFRWCTPEQAVQRFSCRWFKTILLHIVVNITILKTR